MAAKSLKKNTTNKYHAKRTEVDGIIFHSRREASYYTLLRLRERAGEIRDLELQPIYPLLVENIKIASYRADFKFWDLSLDVRRVVDVKGVDTALSKLKRKHVSAQYGIEVEIVR